MISYYLNWMGPISTNWYVDKGLYTQTGTRYSKHLEMDIPVYEKSIELAFGRVDVSGLDYEEYYEGKIEYHCPLMEIDSWNRFADFLFDFNTETLYTFDELVQEYEKNNPKIEWYVE